MSINDISLLKYTLNQATAPTVQSNINVVKTDNVDKTTAQEVVDLSKPVVQSNVNVEFSVDSIGLTLTDEQIEDIVVNNIATTKDTNDETKSVEHILVENDNYKNLSEENIDSIKRLIFQSFFNLLIML